MLDILLVNGRYPDYDDDSIKAGNIGIEGRTIAYIGGDTPDSRLTIDVKGKIVSPGFIDIHMHEDPVLPDGTMVGLHTREQALVVTDKTGRVISRNRVKRTIWRLFSDGGDVYVWEDDKPQMSVALRETRPALWKLVQTEGMK